MSEVRLIYEPKVYLVGRQEVDEDQVARFLSDEGVADWKSDTDIAAQRLVELGSRLCYMSYARPRPGGNASHLAHILEVGHGSVLEHAVFNLIITGVSRSCSHEIVRHRVGISPSQLSQRFVDESDVAFVVPPELIDEVRAAKLLPPVLVNRPLGCGEAEGLEWLGSVAKARQVYSFLADRTFLKIVRRHYPQDGVETVAESREWAKRFQGQGSGEIVTRFRKKARETARSVLPEATETKLFLTGNARAFRHLCEMRGSSAADAEFRRLALAILATLQPEAPALFGDYEIQDGAITTAFRKV